MEVCVIENRVSPNTDPTAFLESTPKRLSFPGPVASDAASKDDHRKMTVRDIIAFLEIELLGRSHFSQFFSRLLASLVLLDSSFQKLNCFLWAAGTRNAELFSPLLVVGHEKFFKLRKQSLTDVIDRF